MKKTALSFYQSNLYKSIFASVLISVLSFKQVRAMPSISNHDSLPAIASSPQKLRAFSYILENTVVMKVNFENPAQEEICIQILNSHKEVVYKENLGKREIFNGKFNLQKLPNGNYTLEVQSPSYTYSRPFSLQTFIKCELGQAENTFDK